MPLANFGIRRQKEIELHERLRKITDAIDRYHDLRAPVGRHRQDQGPPETQAGRVCRRASRSSSKASKLSDGKVVKLLRERDLIDPMTGKTEWNTLSTDDDSDTRSSDNEQRLRVHSKSTAPALDGKTHYNEW